MEEIITERKENRYTIKIPMMFAPAAVHAETPDDKNIINTESIDMSLSGFQIDLKQPLAVGTFIDIIFADSEKTGPVAGEVRWCKKADDGHYHIGIALITSTGKKISGSLIQENTGKKPE